MGCHSCAGITVALSAPGDTEVLWMEQAYGGMNELLRHHGGTLLWGVIAPELNNWCFRSPPLAWSIRIA